jgi:hypothetical protein
LLVNGGIGDRVQAVGDLNADLAHPRAADMVALADDEFADRGSFRHPRNDKLIGSDDHRRRNIAEANVRAITFGQALAPNLELTARNRRRRGHLQYLGSILRALPSSHV